ncbi:MAG: ABC transporter ATP-binding protein [Sphaerochaetaceae bacterium]|nr:ABC transporter ATP-binding protein [Sphaerochaetaceae bacterium]MDD3163991.1 ABC transporter ATP-binding protein [Sphaerochaetaceae bacterium]MDD4007664.1 ABC transporter ATP-binding protein [Sphaerochaetaceae bacterium]MDD4397681.1 ABC transporter ATP-binding protein [Sphaerochaetaceae bacterium]
MLEVNGLCYKNILHNISFTVPDGSFTMIAGRNGSGKSCLLRCIKGLYPHSGHVTCSGSCALVFQDADTQIIGQTVERDLSFGLKCSKEEVTVKVHAIAEEFGLDKLLERRPSTLSGGEKRRLAIADVAITGPDVLMLDEPFANLDYPGIKSVIELLQNLKRKGTTVIMVSHEVEKVLALSDQIIILDQGAIKMQGDADEVFSKADWSDAGIRVTGKREDMLWL